MLDRRTLSLRAEKLQDTAHDSLLFVSLSNWFNITDKLMRFIKYMNDVLCSKFNITSVFNFELNLQGVLHNL